MVKVSAPGKVHLIGEHAVVYGEPAILSAVGLRTFVEAERSGRVIIKDRKRGFSEEHSVEEALDFARRASELWKEGKEKGDFSAVREHIRGDRFKLAAAGTALRMLGVDGGVSLQIDGDIPPGAGLGSSASLALAIAKGISEAYGVDSPVEEINRIGFEVEKLSHGTPSGGDNTACAYGGLIWFQKGNPNVIKPLREEVPYRLENFVLVYTGRPKKTTLELVSHVRNLDEEFRNRRIKAIGNATREMLEALKRRDFPRVKELINLAWDNLSELGLSTPAADMLIGRIREIGGAAKLCGACGGGIMLCYHEDREKLRKVIEEAGFRPMEVELGVEGVRIEEV